MNKHHPLLGASLFALTIAGDGCALIAGYDFDEYTLSDAGAGTSTSASSSSGGGGAGGSSSSSSSSGSSSSGSSSSSSGSSSSGSSSSSGGSSSSSSGLTGGTVLLDDLLCPTTVTIGVDRLIHATGFASGLNSAGWVKLSDLTKGNISFPVPVSEIPGLVGNTSGAYAAVNNSSATPGNLFQVPPPTVTFLCSVGNPIGGVALLGPHLFFTTRQKGGVNGGLYQRSIGSTLPLQQVWMGTDPHGPVAANGTHVYWTQNDTIFRADAADPFKTLEHKGIPTTVRSLAADDQRVWIGHNLGLRAFGVNLDAAGEDIITAGTPVHGIVAEGGGVYFTQGDTLYQVVLGVVTAKVSGFIAPRGVAQDAGNVYVADQGSCSSLSNGKIVKVPK